MEEPCKGGEIRPPNHSVPTPVIDQKQEQQHASVVDESTITTPLATMPIIRSVGLDQNIDGPPPGTAFTSASAAMETGQPMPLLAMPDINVKMPPPPVAAVMTTMRTKMAAGTPPPSFSSQTRTLPKLPPTLTAAAAAACAAEPTKQPTKQRESNRHHHRHSSNHSSHRHCSSITEESSADLTSSHEETDTTTTTDTVKARTSVNAAASAAAYAMPIHSASLTSSPRSAEPASSEVSFSPLLKEMQWHY